MASSYSHTSSPRQGDDADLDDNDSFELDDDQDYYEQGSDEGTGPILINISTLELNKLRKIRNRCVLK